MKDRRYQHADLPLPDFGAVDFGGLDDLTIDASRVFSVVPMTRPTLLQRIARRFCGHGR